MFWRPAGISQLELRRGFAVTQPAPLARGISILSRAVRPRRTRISRQYLPYPAGQPLYSPSRRRSSRARPFLSHGSK